MEYTMEYVESIGPRDEIVEDKGVKLVVDPKAVLFLLGTEMDWKVGKLSSQFIFNNPNQTSACGCGEFRLRTDAGEGLTTAAGALSDGPRFPDRPCTRRFRPVSPSAKMFSDLWHLRRFGTTFDACAAGGLYFRADDQTIPHPKRGVSNRFSIKPGPRRSR
jgi:hypothetical protein